MRKQIRLLRSMGRLRRAGAAPEPPSSATARNVAIIMDGNGRWAARRGLPPLAGHRAGTRALRRTVEAAPDLGVRSLAVYAFSTENWGRPEREVDDLMTLFSETIEREFPDLHRQGVRVRFVGRRDRCPESLRRLMDDMEGRTAANTRLDLWVAFDYGSRAEIVHAVRELVASGVGGGRRRRGAAARSTCTSPTCPTPTWSSARAGRCGCRTSSCGSRPTRSSSSPARSGPTSAERELEAALRAYAGRQRRFGRR